MLGSKLAPLAILWLLSQWGKQSSPGGSAAPAGPTGNPNTPRPKELYPYASALPLPPQTPFSTSYLLNPPELPDEHALLWNRFVVDPNRPGPRAKIDEAPVARALSDFEHWALAPYFIRQDLDNVTLYNGKAPPQVPRELLDKVPETMWAMTFTKPGGPAVIWLPKFHSIMHDRWWVGLLAHELSHGAQGRMGGVTPQQALELFKKYGYEKMPMEIQARWLQGMVLQKLDQRAEAFYRGAPM